MTDKINKFQYYIIFDSLPISILHTQDYFICFFINVNSLISLTLFNIIRLPAETNTYKYNTQYIPIHYINNL